MQYKIKYNLYEYKIIIFMHLEWMVVLGFQVPYQQSQVNQSDSGVDEDFIPKACLFFNPSIVFYLIFILLPFNQLSAGYKYNKIKIQKYKKGLKLIKHTIRKWCHNSDASGRIWCLASSKK